MISRNVTTTITPDKCTGCGPCIWVCPSQTLSLIRGKAVMTGDRSRFFGHCQQDEIYQRITGRKQLVIRFKTR